MRLYNSSIVYTQISRDTAPLTLMQPGKNLSSSQYLECQTVLYLISIDNTIDIDGEKLALFVIISI